MATSLQQVPKCAFCNGKGVWYLLSGAPSGFYCDAHFAEKNDSVYAYSFMWRVVNDQGEIGSGPRGLSNSTVFAGNANQINSLHYFCILLQLKR
jgi:hypothetical protein